VASLARRPDGKWRARYRCDEPCADRGGLHEHTQHFARKSDAEQWLDEHTSAVLTGTFVDPKTAKTTVKQWAATWIDGYGTRRTSTVRQARVHLVQIEAEFGSMPLSAVRPSHVKAWTAKLRANGLSESYVYALHRRLSQLMSDAVHDGIIARSPCSRRTSPGAGSQRAFVATTEQVWALHDAFPKRERAAVLLGAFVGLRVSEACGLRVGDVDFTRGVVTPAVQYPTKPLKNEASGTPVPIPQSLALELAAQVERWPADWLLTNESGGQLHPAAVERRIRAVRSKVPGLPEGFRFHDLRHYFASLLIASGADVKAVQARLRHASATTTLTTYSHLWPDSDDRTRFAVADVLEARADCLRTIRSSSL
jgi:integrase